MSQLTRGILAGLVFATVAVLLMLPMSFPDKSAAIVGAAINRFSVGLVIGAVNLPYPGWLTGLFFGILLSLPDALITKAYAPILIMGSLGGLIIGYFVKP